MSGLYTNLILLLFNLAFKNWRTWTLVLLVNNLIWKCRKPNCGSIFHQVTFKKWIVTESSLVHSDHCFGNPSVLDTILRKASKFSKFFIHILFQNVCIKIIKLAKFKWAKALFSFWFDVWPWKCTIKAMRQKFIDASKLALFVASITILWSPIWIHIQFEKPEKGLKHFQAKKSKKKFKSL